MRIRRNGGRRIFLQHAVASYISSTGTNQCGLNDCKEKKSVVTAGIGGHNYSVRKHSSRYAEVTVDGYKEKCLLYCNGTTLYVVLTCCRRYCTVVDEYLYY